MVFGCHRNPQASDRLYRSMGLLQPFIASSLQLHRCDKLTGNRRVRRKWDLRKIRLETVDASNAAFHVDVAIRPIESLSGHVLIHKMLIIIMFYWRRSPRLSLRLSPQQLQLSIQTMTLSWPSDGTVANDIRLSVTAVSCCDCCCDTGLYPAVCFRGEYETVRGTIEATSRGAKSGGEVWGGSFPLPRDGSPGKYETQFGAIWCILARNLRFSSFPPLWTKTLPWLDSGIDIVT